jgi:hypothetical protein
MTHDRWLVVGMAAVWAIAGVVEPHLPNAGAPLNETGVVQSLAMTLLLFAWCKAHARTHATRPPVGSPLLVALLSPIGLPYYFFRGYGFRKGLALLGLAVLCFLAFATAYFLCFQASARVGT